MGDAGYPGPSGPGGFLGPRVSMGTAWAIPRVGSGICVVEMRERSRFQEALQGMPLRSCLSKAL